MFQIAVSLAGSVEGTREKLCGAEGATVITKTKNIKWSFFYKKKIFFYSHLIFSRFASILGKIPKK